MPPEQHNLLYLAFLYLGHRPSPRQQLVKAHKYSHAQVAVRTVQTELVATRIRREFVRAVSSLGVRLKIQHPNFEWR